MQLFAQATDTIEKLSAVAARPRSMACIFRAMSTYPELVAGEYRFCTLQMQTFRGQMMDKIGADACCGIGVRDSEESRRLVTTEPIGILIKLEDGNLDVMYAGVAEILDRLGLGTREIRSVLDGFHYPRIVNMTGVVTGELSFPFTLKTAI